MDRPAVFLDGAAADGQTQPGALALLFRGEEWLHHLRQVFRRNAQAGVGKLDRYRRPNVILEAGGYAQGQRTAVGHGVARVREQVEEDLPQDLAVGLDHRYVRGEFLHDRDVTAPEVVLHQFERLDEIFCDIHRGRLLRTAPTELEEVRHEIGHPVQLLLDDLQLPVPRIGGVGLAQEGLHPECNGRQRVVQFVGDARRQLAYRGQFRRLPELPGHHLDLFSFRLQCGHGFL